MLVSKRFCSQIDVPNGTEGSSKGFDKHWSVPLVPLVPFVRLAVAGASSGVGHIVATGTRISRISKGLSIRVC